jgi:hypothetical protein
MKRVIFLSMMAAALSLTGCKTTNRASSAKSHEGVMTDEEYFDRIQLLMQAYPGVDTVSHVGGVFSIVFKKVEDAQRMADSFKHAETTGMAKIIAVDGKKVVLHAARPDGREWIALMMSQGISQECVQKVTVTPEGFLVALKKAGPNPDIHGMCVKLLGGFFEIKKQEGNNVLLGYLSKPFICRTKDKSITIETYKDFSLDDGRAIMDMASFAIVKYPSKKVKLDHCEVSVDRSNEELTSMAIVCENASEQIKHEFKMGMGFGFATVLTEGDKEQQTACEWPGMDGMLAGGEGSSSSSSSQPN